MKFSPFISRGHATPLVCQSICAEIVPCVYSLLVLQKVAVAHGVFVEYVDQHLAFPESTPPYKIPLLNFLWLLFRAIERYRTSCGSRLV